MFYSKSTNSFYDLSIHGLSIPKDAVEITQTQHAMLLDGQSQGKRIAAGSDGYPVLLEPVAPTTEQRLSSFISFIQGRLDAFARTRNYDNILSACTYANSGAPRFAAEGSYCLAKRDETWATAYSILAAVNAGTRPMPTEAQVAAELPALAWPV